MFMDDIMSTFLWEKQKIGINSHCVFTSTKGFMW